MTTHDCDIAIIGAGISGLSAAWALRDSGRRVIALDASHHPGGAMRTEHRDGFLLEKGPFNVIVREPAFDQLLDDLEGELPAVAADRAKGRNRYLLRNGRLVKVPTSPPGLVTTPLLSAGGKLRLLRGLLWSTPRRDDSESIDDAVARRFGRQVADRIVSALITGILAADSRELGFAASFPRVASMERDMRSPLGSMLRRAFSRKKPGAAGERPRPPRKGLISFQDGLQSLPELLARCSGAEMRLGCAATSIERRDRGWVLQYSTPSEGGELFCRDVVIATSAMAASRLLAPLDAALADTLSAIDSASLAVVNLAFRTADVGHPLDGYGFLVPRTEPDCPILGALWASSVFPHHAPAGHHLLRVFLGGSRLPEAATMSEADLIETANEALRPLISLSGEPVLRDVCRWPGAIPKYRPDHRSCVARIRKLAGAHDGLHLAGNYLDGVSINDCVGNGVRVAGEIVERIDPRNDALGSAAQTASINA